MQTVYGKKLSARVRFTYGMGELGPAMAGSMLIFYLLYFLTNVAGMSAALAGSVLLVGKAWDAVNDPIIGFLTDKTRSKWGRRLPWMLWSAVPFALLFTLQWWVPPFAADGEVNPWLLFWYFVAISVLFNTAYTAVSLPYASLMPELTHDYDERSRLAGFRMASSLAGSVGGLVLAQVVFSVMEDATPQRQYLVYAGFVGAVGLASVAICLIGIWKAALAADEFRRSEQLPRERIPLMKQLGIVFSNKPFLLVCAIFLFSWLALQFTASILPYYVNSWMRLDDAEFPKVALTVQLTAFLVIPMWSWLSVKSGKKAVYFMGMSFWLAAQCGLLILQPGQNALMYVLAFLAGLGVSVGYLIPNAMLPDVIELDELETGERREGIFFGFFVFLQKLALALGTFIVGQVLQAAGYLSSGPGQPALEQPESALVAIRIAVGPLPAISLVLGLIACWFYPITKRKHAEILAKVAAKKAVTHE